MVKLIAIDLDGTLLNSEHEVSSYTKETLQEARKQGIKIVLCSGRPIAGMRRYIEELELTEADDHVIAFNGAYTKNTHTKQIVSQLSMKHEQLTALYELSREFETPMQYFDVENLYTPNKAISKYTVYQSYLTNVPLYFCPIEEYPKDQIISNIMFVNEPTKIEQAIRQFPKHLYEEFAVAQSTPFFVEFTHPNATKGYAVKQLANRLGIDQKEVMAIGDNENDLTMIEYAGYGVAMQNAIPKIKAAADYETKTNNEDGVANIIQELVLNK